MSGIGQVFGGISQMVVGGAEMVDENQRIRDQGQLERERDLHMAADALARGAVDAGRLRQQGSALIDSQKVAYANSGVDSTVGTAANVQQGTAADVELDAQTLKNNAAAEAWGFDQHRKMQWLEEQSKVAANNRKGVGTILGGAGNLLGGALGAFGGGG